LPNLAKYIYGLSLLEQHHKIEKKNTDYQCDAVLCFLKERQNPMGEAWGTWTLDIGLLKLKKPVLTQI
jgi:hypothetical protein